LEYDGPVVRHSAAICCLTLIATFGASPPVAEADVGDELFLATILLEQAYFGEILLSGNDLKMGSNATVGASLRVELLLSEWIGLGVEGSANYFRPGEGPTLIIGDTPQAVAFEGRHLIAGTNGFLRVRFRLAGGLSEYYFIGGGGPAFMDYDPNDPNAYGLRIAGAGDMGWTAYARFGVRGELMPGFGALVEIGWIHREHLGAFEHTSFVAGAPVVESFDYVINQMSITLGWYMSR